MNMIIQIVTAIALTLSIIVLVIRNDLAIFRVLLCQLTDYRLIPTLRE